MTAAAQAAVAALDRTPTQLDVLADAGVVDAGGRGFLVLLDALSTTLTGHAAPRPRYRPEPVAAGVIEPARATRALMNARVVTEGPPGAPRALIFRDSFGSAMIPFLSEHFSRAVYVWQNDFDTALAADERPAVVIQEWVGRHLYNQTPYDAVAAGSFGQQ